MILNKSNILIETDNKDLDNNIVKVLKGKFASKSINRVLLIQPPDGDESLFNYDAGKRGILWSYPPYGLGLLSAQLKKIEKKVDILNLQHEILQNCRLSKNLKEFDFNKVWKTAVQKKINEFKPDFIGLTSMFSQSHKVLIEISNFIKNFSNNIIIGAGGVHITNSVNDKKTFDKFVNELSDIDYFFLNEADLSFFNFIKVFNDIKSFNLLGNIVIRIDKSKFIRFINRLEPTDEQLNTIPTLELMETGLLTRYGKIGSFFCLKPKNSKITTVLSNRGCRAQCTFCSVRTFNGVGVRRRKVSSVIEELKILKFDYNIDHVLWLDDDFLYDPKESIHLFNEIVRNKLDITWDCTNGLIAAACKDEVIHAARDSGCIGVNIGMESGNREILRKVKKPGTVENFLKAAEVFRRYEEINARVFLLIGFPNESYIQILDTINVANEMNLDWYNVSLLQPLPNTPIFDSMVQEGLIDPKKVEFTDMRYNTGRLGKNMKQIRDRLSGNFSEAFNVSDLNEIPNKAKLDDIWAYMNFHLNFKRLLEEKRQKKLIQKFKYVENITDLISPENCLALYFLGYLENRIFGEIQKSTISDLEIRLEKFPYWKKKFEQYNLSPEHLKNKNFNFTHIENEKFKQVYIGKKEHEHRVK
jgi:radical SAM superfamily enzyme YgiQ (UPF0313 family)|tara:strand:+ start:860 stop:2788 length:1929 start_codon:yes stop_codon:yes gene_type:complete